MPASYYATKLADLQTALLNQGIDAVTYTLLALFYLVHPEYKEFSKEVRKGVSHRIKSELSTCLLAYKKKEID